MTGFLGRANRGVAADMHNGFAQDERFDTMVALPAQVRSFDPKTQTATLQVLWKPRFGGQEVDFPDLLEVPVEMPRGGGGFAMTLPVKAGDQGVVHFASRDQDNWYLDDGPQTLNTDRANSLSDGRFVPGAHAAPKAMANYDPDNVFFGTDDHANGVRVSPDGTVAIEGQGESLMAILSELLGLLATDTLIIKHGSSSGSGHALQFGAEYDALQARLDKMKLR